MQGARVLLGTWHVWFQCLEKGAFEARKEEYINCKMHITKHEMGTEPRKGRDSVWLRERGRRWGGCTPWPKVANLRCLGKRFKKIQGLESPGDDVGNGKGQAHYKRWTKTLLPRVS